MSVILKVEERAVRPRSIRKKLRKEGRVPGSVYGKTIEDVTISVDAQTLDKTIRQNGLNGVYTLDVNGKKINTLLFDYQLDTFTKDWVHVEFLAVDMNEETEVEAELSVVGTAKGMKEGGILEQSLYSVVVSATPDKLPEQVEVDITDLAIGDALTIADIPEHDDYTIVNDPEEQILVIGAPRAIEEIEETEEGEAPSEEE